MQTGKTAEGRLISVQKDTRFLVYLKAAIGLIALLGLAVTARVVLIHPLSIQGVYCSYESARRTFRRHRL